MLTNVLSYLLKALAWQGVFVTAWVAIALVALYFNRREQASLLNRILLWFSTTVSGLRTEYEKKPYLHAKFIIFTMPDGKKVAISGSHNFAYTGVLFGTREIALETKDPAIIEQLESFVKQHVA